MDALAVIQRLAGGGFLDKLAYALTNVGEQVVVTGNNGTVTVTFKLKQWHDDPVVLIEEGIKEGLPVASPRGAMFYAIGNGTLELDDPRQPSFPEFRTVDSPHLAPRVIADEAQVQEIVS